jgi:N-acetylmuramoyl-L-alanine amidase
MPLLTQDQVMEEVARRRAGRSRHWRWQKALVNLLMVAGVLLMLWLAATDLLGPAIDHELDRMPTAESVAVVVEDEPADLDQELLAALIHAEARGEPYQGKVAVGAVVLNRVNDPRWPDTVEGVVLQPGQFATPTEATPEAERAAREALSGVNPVGDSVYFYNAEVSRCGWIRGREVVTVIENHTFAR